MVKLENITYRYPNNPHPALLNVSLEVAVGESVCLMGANGSGKSTAAKLIAGLIKSQQGRISVRADKNIPIPVGLLFQNPDNQMVADTVEKEIAFALENLAISQSEMEKRIHEILKRFSIVHLRKRLTSELSVGEKQRVALAALLVANPPVLVLDEPDSFLDRDGKELFRNCLDDIKSQSPHLTVIEVTQYPEVAREYDRLIVFQSGRIAADGSPESILNNKSLCLKCGLDYAESNSRIQFVNEDKSATEKRNSTVISKIKMERVSFTYPGSEKAAIRHFSGEIGTGEITAIVGPSGSGKSTLGMLLCCIHKPDSGIIHFIDKSNRVIESGNQRGKITAALQQPERQFFLHSCEEEVEFGPRNFGRKISRKELQNLFALVGLPFEQFFERDPFTLSLGEKRRLGFATVLSIYPDFIIFDEPTCALDREGIGRFVALARALKSSGAGVVVISHDEEIVKFLADRIIVLDAHGSFWSVRPEEYFEKDSRKSGAIAKITNQK